MMRLFRLPILAFFLLASVSVVVNAQDEEIPSLESSISFGYLGTSGNTDTETFNTEFLATYNTLMWKHNFKFQATGTQEDGVSKAERYYLDNKSDYNLSDIHYLYVQFTYTDDRFSGFDYQADLNAGYGRHLIQRDTFRLQGFAGVGYRESDITDGIKEDEFIFTLGEELDWNISESSRLYQNLKVSIGEIRTVTRFEIGLESTIVDRLATRIAFQIRNSSEVPVGKEKTDTQTSISLAYSF